VLRRERYEKLCTGLALLAASKSLSQDAVFEPDAAPQEKNQSSELTSLSRQNSLFSVANSKMVPFLHAGKPGEVSEVFVTIGAPVLYGTPLYSVEINDGEDLMTEEELQRTSAAADEGRDDMYSLKGLGICCVFYFFFIFSFLIL
jgi:hypothetical protein